jgi:hypothetical protein
VTIRVEDLNEVEDLYRTRLASVVGGRYDGHGVSNRLVPVGRPGAGRSNPMFGPYYVEYVAVDDPDEAAGSPFGTWVSNQAPFSGLVCLRTDDIDAVCVRLGIESSAWPVPSVDGEVLQARVAGMDEAMGSKFPYFTQWPEPKSRHPGFIRMSHPRGTHMLRTEIAGPRSVMDAMREWAPLELTGAWSYATQDSEPQVSIRLIRFEDGLTD